MELLRLSYRAGHNLTAPMLHPALNNHWCHPSLLVSFNPIIHQSHIPALRPQARTDRVPTRVKLHQDEAPRDHHTTIPGLLLNQLGPQKRPIKSWRTIVLFFLSLSLSFWHVDHGKPAAVIRAFLVWVINQNWQGWGDRRGLVRLAG